MSDKLKQFDPILGFSVEDFKRKVTTRFEIPERKSFKEKTKRTDKVWQFKCNPED